MCVRHTTVIRAIVFEWGGDGVRLSVCVCVRANKQNVGRSGLQMRTASVGIPFGIDRNAHSIWADITFGAAHFYFCCKTVVFVFHSLQVWGYSIFLCIFFHSFLRFIWMNLCEYIMLCSILLMWREWCSYVCAARGRKSFSSDIQSNQTIFFLLLSWKECTCTNKHKRRMSPRIAGESVQNRNADG